MFHLGIPAALCMETCETMKVDKHTPHNHPINARHITAGSVAKGSRFFGGLGVEVCSLDVVLPLATVRPVHNEGPMAVPMTNTAKTVIIRCFDRCVMSFCVARLKLHGMPICLKKRPKLP